VRHSIGSRGLPAAIDHECRRYSVEAIDLQKNKPFARGQRAFQVIVLKDNPSSVGSDDLLFSTKSEHKSIEGIDAGKIQHSQPKRSSRRYECRTEVGKGHSVSRPGGLNRIESKFVAAFREGKYRID
jgi:hypothetical protein